MHAFKQLALLVHFYDARPSTLISPTRGRLVLLIAVCLSIQRVPTLFSLSLRFALRALSHPTARTHLFQHQTLRMSGTTCSISVYLSDVHCSLRSIFYPSRNT
jgi:hypothetical protein